MLCANLREQVIRVLRIYYVDAQSEFVGQRLYRFLSPFVLRGVNRVDACIAEYPRQLLRARLTGGTQINIGIVRINNLLGMTNEDDSRDWSAKRCVVPEHNDRAQNRKQHREHHDGPQPGFWFRGFFGHLSINYSANSARRGRIQYHRSHLSEARRWGQATRQTNQPQMNTDYADRKMKIKLF